MLKELIEWFTTLAQNHQQPLSGNKFKLFALIIFFYGCSPKVNQPTTPPTQPKVITEEKPIIEKKKNLEISTYHISLLLPFKLNLVNYKIATQKDIEKVALALDYYQGIKMALDSVSKSTQTNFILKVIDTKDDDASIKQLSYLTSIRNSDLIIGPVYPNGLKIFSDAIKTLQIPLVSPLAPTINAELKNTNLIVVGNTLAAHANTAASFIKYNIRPKKTILIRSGQADEAKYAKYFKTAMDSLAKEVYLSEIGIKAVGYKNVFQHLTTKGMNTIVLPSTDKLFLVTILKELEGLSKKYEITVIGHPNWEKISYLNAETLQNVNAHITSSFKVDYKDFNTKKFLINYRRNFSIEPSEYAIKAFDTGFYFGNLMAKYGKNFKQNLISNSFDGLHNQIKFYNNSISGFSNNHVMVLKYSNFNMIKVN